MTSFDHPIVTQRYFFPRREVPAPVTHVDVDGARLACAALPGAGAHAPTLVHFHGNGEVVADYVPDWDPLLSAWGVQGFFAEYRGYGGSTGTPKLRATFDDLPAIAAAVDAPPERQVVFGRSIGSIYALEYARQNPGVAGLVLESGIFDVLERILLRAEPRELGATLDELRQEATEHFDHAAKMASVSGHVLVLHAEQDHLVSAEHGRRNHDAATSAASRELVLFPHGDHNSIFWANQRPYIEAVRALLTRCFPGDSP